MSVKSSIVIYRFKCRCQSALQLLRNNFEHSCDQVVLEWYFRKKYHNSDGSGFHLVVLLPLVLNKKIKMETQNIRASSYPLKVSSTQNKGVPFSSCLAHGI